MLQKPAAINCWMNFSGYPTSQLLQELPPSEIMFANSKGIFIKLHMNVLEIILTMIIQ